ncbi:unnamed protein product [Gongylonema pulchrum]|uniref:C-type lectin domain-containing protein n=1 Tax=Gongylonema pulchrum TaxID=637853 RepID=A0A183CZ43_9BILA|nr:unnamed protein product [Gongylonema pulchrum]
MFGTAKYFLVTFLLAVFIKISSQQGLPCGGDEDCGVFDVCVLDMCIANHQECWLDNHEDCEVFEYCLDGECVPDHQDCPNGTRPEDQVCVKKKCEVHPDTKQGPPEIIQDCSNGTCPAGQVCMNKKCELLLDTTQAPPETTQVTVAAPPCKVGWIHKPSQKACYMVKKGSHSFHEARSECLALSAQLATIRNGTEMHEVNGKSTLNHFLLRILLCNVLYAAAMIQNVFRREKMSNTGNSNLASLHHRWTRKIWRGNIPFCELDMTES